MKFTVHDVGQGFCAHLQHDNGNVMLWDCGHKADPENRPSVFLPRMGIKRVHRFFVTNYDQDHISDLLNLVEAVDIIILHRNKTIPTAGLRTLKAQSGPISEAMECFLSMNERFNHEVTDPPNFPGITFSTYHCNYPNDFQDTNNLSLVTFLKTPLSNFVIPGDLETAAWQKLLERDDFRRDLQDTHVFIASHHGRTNGYCAGVFAFCRPNVVIFSDSEQQYATQQESSTYNPQAGGIMFNGVPRKVLTTRNDGSLTWSSN